MTRRRRRILDDDGLDVVEFIDEKTPPTEYPKWAREPFGGFEAMVRDAEQYWKVIAGEHPVTPGTDASLKLTRPAYAHRITWGVQLLRHILRKAPD